MIRQYKEGKLSLSRLSQELEKPIGEVMDKLSDPGAQSPLEKSDVLEGYNDWTKDY